MGFAKSFLLVTAGSILWIVGSLIVAFPAQAMQLDLVGIMSTFITEPRHPVSVLILWMLDLFISLGCLQDGRMRAGMAKWLGTLMLCMLGYLGVAVYLPTAVPQFVSANALWLAVVALGCILIARGLSYAGPEYATSVQTLQSGT